MARKTLLTESELRRFMKLAQLNPVGDDRLQELGPTYAGARDEDDPEALEDYAAGDLERGHPDEAAAGLDIMTAWIGRIHRAVKRSGKDRELLLRVPADIDGCREVGLEPLEWMRRGLVDAVVPEASGTADPSADFGAFVAAAKGTRCRVLPALQSR